MSKRSVAKVVLIIAFITILTTVLVINFMKVEFKVDCRFHDSINITGSHQFKNGSHQFENNIFHEEFTKEFDYIIVNGTKRTVDSHLRGCICAFKSCIRICKPFSDIKIFNKYNESEIVDLNNTHYHVLVGKPCGKYYEIEDEWWHFLAVSFITFVAKNITYKNKVLNFRMDL